MPLALKPAEKLKRARALIDECRARSTLEETE